jgi:hypothetical protein
MPDVIETTVYRLDELSEAAKDNARAWYREGGFDYDWYDAVYEDFRRIADILGIRIKSRTVRLMGGGVRQEPCIWFTGFWSQGDGAAFEGHNFYQLTAEATHRGRYYHEYCMAISVTRDSPTWQDMTADAEETVMEALRDLARWLYRQLEREYDYLTSDEAVDEAIVANEYSFTVDGKRFG